MLLSFRLFWRRVAHAGLVLCIASATRLIAGDEPKFPELPLPAELAQRYLAAERIRYEHAPIFRGTGEVLVGRLVSPAGTRVASRTRLYADGSFSTAVYPGRKLVFYAHGHDALEITEGEELLPGVRDVGEHRFTVAPPERLRRLLGHVELGEPQTQPPPAIEAKLGITNLAYLYSDHGHRGGPVTVEVEKRTLRNGDAFAFEGLSAIPYDLTLNAPGYIKQRIELDPEALDSIELGAIRLLPAPVLTFTYVSHFDLDAAEGWGDLRPQTRRIVCDGNTRFDYTEVRAKLGNRIYLRLDPGEQGVTASFWALPSFFHDLGEGSLADFLSSRDWLTRVDGERGTWQQVLQRGHVYFFRDAARDTHCLFAVE